MVSLFSSQRLPGATVLMAGILSANLASCEASSPPSPVSPANVVAPAPTASAAASSAPPLALGLGEAFVNQGTQTDAENYYKQMAVALGLPVGADGIPTDIDALLTYCGYPAGYSQVLLRTEVFDDSEALSTRYFAPKITDVSKPGTLPSTGWRKVIRVKPRAGSPAAKKNIPSVYVLFNVFIEPDSLKNGVDPFAHNPAKNNQVLIVQQTEGSTKPLVWWYVFNDAGKTQLFLPASFDARAPDLPATTKYFVPAACNQCHGALDRGDGKLTAKVNYVDSDHIFDRVQANDDFSQVRDNPRWGVLRDGGKVSDDGGPSKTTPDFEKAFDRLRRINGEIMAQNRLVDETSFQYRAVENWVNRHKDSRAWLKPIDRPIPSKLTWSAGNQNDQALLPLLNRYCFRCHSSVAYSVFDKFAVWQKVNTPGKRGLISRMETEDKILRMPQDRLVPAEDLAKFKPLLEALKKEPAPPP